MSQVFTPRQIPTDKRFYITKRDRGHDDWRFAFWRELFQNSVDAGARNIKITMGETDSVPVSWVQAQIDAERELAISLGNEPPAQEPPHKVLRVEFEDDGSGMTREVMENVFFTVGRTTKIGQAGATGGFGTARIMLCFSQDSYQIHTGGLLAEGDGGEFLVRDLPAGHADRVTNGCRFVVDIDQRRGDEFGWSFKDESSMRQKLVEFLSFSQVPGRVTLNGELMNQRLLHGPARRVLQHDDNDFATVYLSGGAKANKGTVIVRMNGSCMFTREYPGKRQVILEIDPTKGRDILTENRDAFTSGYKQALDELLTELTLDSRSAMRDQKQEQKIYLRGSLGMMISNWARPRMPSELNHVQGGDEHSTQQEQAEENSPRAVRLLADDVAKAVEAPETICRSMPNVLVQVNDLSGAPAIAAAARRWNPQTWGAMNPANGTAGAQMHQLLVAWTAACQHAVNALQHVKKSPSYARIEFVPGWYFVKPGDDFARAICSQLTGEKRYALLLNPVHANGKSAYSISSFDDPKPDDEEGQRGLKSLVALAIHEAAHIAVYYHGEEFAAIMTSMMERIDQREVFRSMQQGMAEVSKFYKYRIPQLQAELTARNQVAQEQTGFDPNWSEASRTPVQPEAGPFA